METLDQLIDRAAQLAGEIFGSLGMMLPTWLYVLKNGNLEGVVPQGTQDKDAVAEAMRELFKSLGVERYVSITEAWTDIQPPHSVKHGASLAVHLGRREVVWLFAEDKIEARVAMLFILRPKHGRPTLSQLHKVPSAEWKVGGRFVGLLSERQEDRHSFTTGGGNLPSASEGDLTRLTQVGRN
jgi:hypothetical protein